AVAATRRVVGDRAHARGHRDDARALREPVLQGAGDAQRPERIDAEGAFRRREVDPRGRRVGAGRHAGVQYEPIDLRPRQRGADLLAGALVRDVAARDPRAVAVLRHDGLQLVSFVRLAAGREHRVTPGEVTAHEL